MRNAGVLDALRPDGDRGRLCWRPSCDRRRIVLTTALSRASRLRRATPELARRAQRRAAAPSVVDPARRAARRAARASSRPTWCSETASRPRRASASRTTRSGRSDLYGETRRPKANGAVLATCARGAGRPASADVRRLRRPRSRGVGLRCWPRWRGRAHARPCSLDEFRTPLAVDVAASGPGRARGLAGSASGLLHVAGPERLSRLRPGPRALLRHAQAVDGSRATERRAFGHARRGSWASTGAGGRDVSLDSTLGRGLTLRTEIGLEGRAGLS